MNEKNSKRVLVVAHVFYPQFWEELRDCIGNVGPEADVIVTYVDEASVVAARRDLPQATFLLCENRGFDIWPFLKALATVDLDRYRCIVKLHTKRDIVKECDWTFNHCRFNGAAWRNHLLAFCRTPEAWRRTASRLSEPGVGMVADRHVIVRRRDMPWTTVRACFDDAVREIRAVPGCRTFDERTAQYVSGTMFAVRPEPLAFLLSRGFESDRFVVSGHRQGEEIVYAHVVENLLGLAVSAVGMRIAAFNGSLQWRRLYAPVLMNVFRTKETRRRRIVKLFGLPIWWVKKGEALSGSDMV